MTVEYALPSLFRSRIVIVRRRRKADAAHRLLREQVGNDEAAIFDGEEPEEKANLRRARSFAETLESPGDQELSRSAST